MPIVDVLVVQGAEGAAPLPPARAFADALGHALGAPPGRVWVRLGSLAPGHYAENDVRGDDTPAPVFVTLLHARPPEGEARAHEAMAVAVAVAQVCACDVTRVHVEYATAGRGRIAFGGRVVE
jgi:phenylpyruvate tautomerase PptA (4-oxalocrotonate tautomerase family)